MPMEGQYHEGIGRRKAATARVRLFSGDGSIIVNDKPVQEYFTRDIDVRTLRMPLQVAGLDNSFDVSFSSQAFWI